MRIYFVFFIVFGLWTSWKNIDQNLSFRVFSLISVPLAFSCFALSIFFNTFHEFDTLYYTMTNLMFGFIHLTHLIIVLESFLRKSQMDLIERFSRVDDLFAYELNIQMPYQREKWRIFVRIMALTCIEIIAKLSVLGSRVYYGQHYQFFYSIFLPNAIICFRQFEMLFFVYLLENRLKLINIELIKMHKYAGLVYSNKYYHCQSTFSRILCLKRIYSELFEICEQLRKSFGWSLLLIFVNAFAISAFESYCAYIQIAGVIKPILRLVYALSSVIILGVLAIYGTFCIKQVNKCGSILLVQ